MHLADTPALRIAEEADGTTTVLRLAGELDLATAYLLRERVRSLATATTGVRRLTVDLGGLEFLDVTGLGALLEAHHQLGELGASVTLRRPRPLVVRMLSLLCLQETLQIEN